MKRALLKGIRSDPATPARRAWTRFVLIRLDSREAAHLAPRTAAGALVLLDRHYNSLRPYRKNERNLYAVRQAGACAVRAVEAGDGILLLRPQNPEASVEVLPIGEGHTPSDLLIGRVAYIAGEI